ncbi:uncharacterized protein LOC127581717 [Pristis pectinata]|uniref:uncharacterized protein LOC127581717 n=1 Tax=Pristis pectinata TaxID=685728 RepID=UPI00223CA131|nr:uncharacterized protein LOC127581717 [Pristis pectinata]
MWLYQIPVLISAFAGSFALTELPKPIQVQFNSSNFMYILHWTPQGPEDSVYDVEYQIYGDVWKSKSECYHTSAHYCDLTNEIAQEDNWYYARVMAVWKNTSSSWSMSKRFCPLDKTVVGAPEVKYTVSTRSIKVRVEPPTVPPIGGLQRSIKNIFSVVEYNVQLSKPATNKVVFLAENENGKFTVEPLEPNTEYCGTVKLVLKRGIFSKESQTVDFCIKTEQEWTLMVILPTTGFILFGVLIIGTFIWMAHSYTRHHRTLPQALVLDKILLKKHSSLQSTPTRHLISSHKDIFQFEKIVHMEDICLLKYHSRDTEEILKPRELGLVTQWGTYAPQHHTRKLQTNFPSCSDCETQGDISSGLVDSGCSSPYRPQSSEGLSNAQASSQNGSRSLAENYGAVLQMISPEIDAIRDSLTTTQNKPLNALQMLRKDLFYNKGGQILWTGPGMGMQISKLLEGEPIPFLSLQDDKQRTHPTDWKENQPMETSLVSSLKEEIQINPLLCQYRPQVKTETFPSLSKDKDDASFMQCEGMDDQPSKEVSLTDVLQTDGHLPRPLLDEFTVLAQVKPMREREYKSQVLTLHSSIKEGQRQTLRANTTVQPSNLLADWEIHIHIDE